MMRSPQLVLVLTAIAVAALTVAVPADAQPLPAAATCSIWFTGGSATAPHDWKTSDNWSVTDGGVPAGRIPTTADTVCMSTTPVTADVVVQAVNPTIRSIDFSATAERVPSLTVTGRFRLVKGLSTVNDLAADGANLVGAGLLTLTGTATVSDTVTLDLARVTNTGTLVLQPAATVRTTPAAVGAAPGLLNKGAVQTAGTSSSSGVTLAGPVTNAGTVTTAGAPMTLAGGNVAGSTDTGTWNASAAPITLTADRTITAGRTLGSQPFVVDGATLTSSRPDLAVKDLRLTGGGRLLAQDAVSITVLTSDDGVLDGGSTVTLTDTNVRRPKSTVHQLTVTGGTTLVSAVVVVDGRVSILGGATVEITGRMVLTGSDVTIDSDTDGDHGSRLLLRGAVYSRLDPAGTAVISAVTTAPHATDLRPEPDLAGDRRPRPGRHRLVPDARPARPRRPPLGTETATATAVLHRRPPRRPQPHPPPAPRRRRPMGRTAAHRHRPVPGTTSPNLTSGPPHPTTPAPPTGPWTRRPPRASAGPMSHP